MTNISPDQMRALCNLRGTRAVDYLEQQLRDTMDALIDAKESWLIARFQGRAAVLRDLLSIINDEG